jgi:hypothetical protein
MSKDCKANNSGLNKGWLLKVAMMHYKFSGNILTFCVAYFRLSEMYSVNSFFNYGSRVQDGSWKVV